MAWYEIMLIFAVTVLIVGGGAFAWYIKRAKSISSKNSTFNTNANKKANKKESRRRFLQALYKRMPFIKSLYSKTYNRLSAICPEDITSISRRTTNLITNSLLLTLAIIGIGVATSHGNVIYIVAFITIAYICNSLYIDVYLESMERKLLYSLKNVLPKISKAYDKTRIVSDAIYTVYLSINEDTSFSKKKGLLGSLSKARLSNSQDAIMGAHLERLYKVLTAPNSQRAVEVQKYISASPNVYLTLLLSICSHIEKKGDRGLAEGTGSSFKKQVFELQELVNDEVLNTESFYYAMRSLPFLALGLSIPLIKPLEAFCYYCMPDLKNSNFFGGAYGIALIVLVFAITIFCYHLIMQIKAPSKPVNARLSIWYRLSETKTIKRYLGAYITKHYSKAEKKQKSLKEAGVKISIRQFYVKKISFAVIGFVASVILCITGVVVEKINSIPAYTQAFEETVLPNEAYRDLMKQVAEDCSRISGNKMVDKKTLTEIVTQDGRIKNTDYIDIVAEEMLKKNSSYMNVYFRWYFLVISLIIAVIAFFIPEFFLKKDLAMAKTRKADEINQFRSIISLLMETGGVTTDVILADMNKFAVYYKEPISKCLISLDRNERKALEELKASEKGDEEFINIVDGLLNITHAGVVKSFESIKADKQFYRENRKLEIERINKSKIAKANLYWQIPFYACIILTMFIPLGVSALESLLQTGIM